jgi:hypothetical protein
MERLVVQPIKDFAEPALANPVYELGDGGIMQKADRACQTHRQRN